MADIALKVVIATRTYPLTVKQEDAEGVLAAAKLINDKIKEFEQNYSVRDKQDLIAMCALNLVASKESNSDKSQENVELINELNNYISSYLQKEKHT